MIFNKYLYCSLFSRFNRLFMLQNQLRGGEHLCQGGRHDVLPGGEPPVPAAAGASGGGHSHPPHQARHHQQLPGHRPAGEQDSQPASGKTCDWT